MPEHIYDKQNLVTRFDAIIGKALEAIDNIGVFEHVQDFNRQKGVVGTIIEQCVLGYPPDSKQEPDLIVVDGAEQIKTELKSTGMVLKSEPKKHYVAKEPMSITGVGIYDLIQQDSFFTSHFWQKLEHLLIVYYHYDSDRPVSPYEYRQFKIKGYEFHEFNNDDKAALKQDWENVYDLVRRVVYRHSGVHDKEWKEAVKQDYIDVHGELRPILNYIDLAPKFPPRFRLKKPIVSMMIANHFGYALEQLPGRYSVLSDIDKRCEVFTRIYSGKTIRELISELNISLPDDKENKAITERIAVAMFGGKAERMSDIDVFAKFGLIGKTVVMTPKGGRTEDMKLFHVDFNEFTQTEIEDDDGNLREFEFEDSELYSYFADHEFLCILYEEPPKEYTKDSMGKRVEVKHSLFSNKFIGFKRVVLSDAFLNGPVRLFWEDTRKKIFDKTLTDVIQYRKDGSVVLIKSSGEVSSAPNFMKSIQNEVFMRGSGDDSSSKHKTETVNGIKMLPQYVWIKGKTIVDEILNPTQSKLTVYKMTPDYGVQVITSDEST